MSSLMSLRIYTFRPRAVTNSHRIVYSVFLRARSCISCFPRREIGAVAFSHISNRQIRRISNTSIAQSPPAQPFNGLKGRTCMVTGGSSGIGLAIAQRFLREGVERIIIVGTDKTRLLRAFEKLQTVDAAIQAEKNGGMRHGYNETDTVEATQLPLGEEGMLGFQQA